MTYQEAKKYILKKLNNLGYRKEGMYYKKKNIDCNFIIKIAKSDLSEKFFIDWDIYYPGIHHKDDTVDVDVMCYWFKIELENLSNEDLDYYLNKIETAEKRNENLEMFVNNIEQNHKDGFSIMDGLLSFLGYEYKKPIFGNKKLVKTSEGKYLEYLANKRREEETSS